MSMVVSGPQVTSGVPKNNDASDHGNTNRQVRLAEVIPRWRQPYL